MTRIDFMFLDLLKHVYNNRKIKDFWTEYALEKKHDGRIPNYFEALEVEGGKLIEVKAYWIIDGELESRIFGLD